MKRYPIWKIVSIIVCAILAIAEIISGVLLVLADILPNKHLFLLFGIFVLVDVLIGFLLFLPFKTIRGKKIPLFQIIGYVLSLAVLIGSLYISAFVVKVNQTLSAITSQSTITAIVDVYVPADSPAKTIDDAKNYTFAVTDSYDWTNTQKAIAAIEAKLGCKLNTVTYPSVLAMIEALYSEKADALLLNSAYLSILNDAGIYTDFGTRTRVLFQFSVEEVVSPKPTTPSESETTGTTSTEPSETSPDKKNEIAPFVIYLSGIDSYAQYLTTSLSDVNVVAVVNPQTKQILLVNTPRDYYVANPAGGGAKDKLTHCGIYGINCSMEALENLYNEDITYHARINFTGFETLVDAIGGVTVYSELAYTTHHGGFPIQVGDNHLNGIQAVCFARERYALTHGDNDRGQNHMKLITAIINKMSTSTLLANYAEILDSLQGMFTTDLPQENIRQLVKTQLSDSASWTIHTYAVNGTDAMDETYSMPGMDLCVTYPDQPSIDLASQLIDRVMAGEILVPEDLIPQ